jgi:hypothetical protein
MMDHKRKPAFRRWRDSGNFVASNSERKNTARPWDYPQAGHESGNILIHHHF